MYTYIYLYRYLYQTINKIIQYTNINTVYFLNSIPITFFLIHSSVIYNIFKKNIKSDYNCLSQKIKIVIKLQFRSSYVVLRRYMQDMINDKSAFVHVDQPYYIITNSLNERY